MVHDPPPPYPGPPIASGNFAPEQHQQQPQRELRDSVTNEPLFAFNRYGLMVPPQQVTAVTIRQSPLANVNILLKRL